MKSRPIGNNVDAADFSVGTIVIARLMQLYVVRSCAIIIYKNRIIQFYLPAIRGIRREYEVNGENISLVLFRFYSGVRASSFLSFFLIESLLLLLRSFRVQVCSILHLGEDYSSIKCNTIYIDRREN